MSNQTLRWLLPPDNERWLGLHAGTEVAQVWAEGSRGNQISKWNWLLLTKSASGSLDGTGDDELDRHAAQSEASSAYFAMS